MRKIVRFVLIVVTAILALLVIGLPFVPIPPLVGVVDAHALADPDSLFVDVPLGRKKVNVHYKRQGAGEPTLVLLHGFAASTFSWREVMAPLAQQNSVIAFDRPAFGLTQRPMREEWDAADWKQLNPYSSQAQVALTIGLMDELGIERTVLVGNSAGGAVAMLTALAHPERVTALILIDPAVYTGGGQPRWMRAILNAPQLRRVGPLLARRIQDWGKEFGYSAWHDSSLLTDEVWFGYTKPLQVNNWDRALWELTAASQPNGLAQRLAEIKIPTLVITGDDDRIVPTAESVRLVGELPNATLVVIPNCGHVPHEECPAPTLEAVKRFLQLLPPAQGD